MTTDAPTEQPSFLHRRLTFRVELAVALLITALAIAAHIRFLVCARGLWRDEVNSVNMAAVSFPQTWQKLQFDTFPLAHTILLKIWMTLGLGGSDLSLRVSGLLVGIGLLAAVWWSARWLGATIPILAVALLALNPVLIRYGDSLRPYGFGAAMTVLTCALTWRLVEKPDWRRAALMALGCVLSAHSSFQNCTVVFACCTGLAMISILRREWKLLATGTAAGGIAAISLLPYVPWLRASGEWTKVIPLVKESPEIPSALATMFSGGWPGLGWLWIFIALIALAISAWRFFPRRPRIRWRDPQALPRLRVLYCLVVLVVTLSLMTILIYNGGFLCRPWHMLSLLPLAAVSADALIFADIPADATTRGMRMTLTVALCLLMAPFAFTELSPAQTNINIIADAIAKDATKDDLVIVAPWYLGVTFQRYYHGPAEWTTIPPLQDHSIHRYDQIKALMLDPSPVDPAIGKIYAALSSGRRIWIVGGLTSLPSSEIPSKLPTPPTTNWGWSCIPYVNIWEARALLVIRALASGAQGVPIEQNTQPLENYPLTVILPGRR